MAGEEGGVVLILHGNQQTGDLLLGRIDKLTKRLKKEFGLEAIAPDAPFLANPENGTSCLRTWWNREGDTYVGLEDSLTLVQSVQEQTVKPIVGILGFSQGARFCHLLAILHQQHPNQWLPHLKFSILVAGYDKPLPPELRPYCQSSNSVLQNQTLELPSLHIWGSKDPLITQDEFDGLVASYKDSETYIHPGKHFVPCKGSELPVYIDFVQKALASSSSQATKTPDPTPDEETAELQQEEVQALEAIFPGALDLRSPRSCDDDGEEKFGFPIVYRICLNDMEMEQEDDDDENDEMDTKNWPKHPLTVEVRYPVHYPSDDPSHEESTAIPRFKLLHQNTVFEFPSAVSAKLVSVLQEQARNELGMSCVLSCLYAAREFLDEDRDWDDAAPVGRNYKEDSGDASEENDSEDAENEYETGKERHHLIQPSTPSEIRKGALEGLEIAQTLLANSQSANDSTISNLVEPSTLENHEALYRGSGSFGTYTIGLVGKPSAGKSTFFNAATAFSRQRGQHQEAASGKSAYTAASAVSSDHASNDATNDGLGGASMAAHPFTTIDPNVGYCLIPAPPGSCPEETSTSKESFGSSHGRDAKGRRFLPVLLKDVAGLVPGAYQGKGRGNQFLNDLTDSAVLIHVVDASGSADASGNKIVVDDGLEKGPSQELTNPLDDLAWIRAELVEWVYSNLVAKWETISRKGRSKLAGMFSGYGQKVDMAETVFPALEKFLEDKYQRERALDKIYQWDEADIQRLVSLFLGVRFPMALCLNKHDLPSSKAFVNEAQNALPIHGAHVGIPLSAKKEMSFVKEQMIMTKSPSPNSTPPFGVWNCLMSAIHLREPVLVFPVSDMTTLAPMSSLNKVAIGDASLPNAGMVRCIEAAGGSAPSCWDSGVGQYVVPTKESGSTKLRDVILMKPGSTVEDVFLTLKRLGALGGEFVRAEASSGDEGERPKPVSKQEIMGRKNRVIKIMTNKCTQWQHTATEKNERRRYQSKR